MEHNIIIQQFCDVCGKELSGAELDKNSEFENYEFPVCDACFGDAMEKIKYIINS